MVKWQREIVMTAIITCLGLWGLIVGGNSITAQGDAQGYVYHFILEPVDEATGKPIYVPDGAPESLKDGIWSAEHGLPNHNTGELPALAPGVKPTYRNALDDEGKRYKNQIDYALDFNYLSEMTNDSFGLEDNIGKSEFDWPNLTLSNSNDRNNVNNFFSMFGTDSGFGFDAPDKTKYTFDASQFEINLDKDFNYETHASEDDIIQVPFKKSSAEIKLTVNTYPAVGDMTSQKDYETVWGVAGEKDTFKKSDVYDLSMSSVTFNGSADQKETLVLIAKDRPRTATIKYVYANGSQAKPTQKVSGKVTDDAQTITSPTIAGYTPNQTDVNVDFSTNAFKTNPDQTITVTYTKKATNSGSTSTPSGTVKDDVVANASLKVYAKQALYRYQHADFKKSDRIQGYAQKNRTYAPVFDVVKTVKSTAGHTRYELSDGTYITANPDYTGKLYWQGTYPKLYVTNPKGINRYQTVKLATKVNHVKQGTALAITQVVKRGPMTCYKLADGTYVTGNKQLVSPIKPKVVMQVKAKTRVRLYKTVNLKQVIKTYKKGSIITVKGWDYSYGSNPSISGTKRYQVAGGYITANSRFVTPFK